jgi:hypothetical protein
MPGVSGSELLWALREDPQHRDCGRMIITAYAEEAPVRESIQRAEAHWVFTKPWTTHDGFLEAIRKALDQFVCSRELDSFLSARVVDYDRHSETILALRRAWRRFLTMGSGASTHAAFSDGHSDLHDDSSHHVLVSRVSRAGSVPLAVARTRALDLSNALWLDGVAFEPSHATEETERILVRTAMLAAHARGAMRVATAAPLQRVRLYRRLGFASSRANDDDFGGVNIPPWAVLLHAPLDQIGVDAAYERFRAQRQLCACRQSGCFERDYAAARRSYYCPFDVLHQRAPA